MKVVFGDTDSVAFVLSKLSYSTANMIAIELTSKTADYLESLSGVRPTLLRLEIDKLCSAFYIQPSDVREGGTKKRYAAFVIWETGQPTFKLMTKGFSVVRHDSSEAQKEFQTQGLMLNLSDATAEQKTAFCETWKRKLYAGELDEKIVMNKGLGKNPDEYKVLPPFLRVGRQLEQEGKLVLHKGDKIAYLKVGPKPEDVMAVLPGVKLSLTREQYAYLWDNQFRRIALRLGIDTPKEQQPKQRGKQATL